MPFKEMVLRSGISTGNRSLPANLRNMSKLPGVFSMGIDVIYY